MWLHRFQDLHEMRKTYAKSWWPRKTSQKQESLLVQDLDPNVIEPSLEERQRNCAADIFGPQVEKAVARRHVGNKVESPKNCKKIQGPNRHKIEQG